MHENVQVTLSVMTFLYEEISRSLEVEGKHTGILDTNVFTVIFYTNNYTFALMYY